MIFNVSGGGGAALNFRVLAYATEEELLAATPNENAIGIITDTPIKSWLFSATEPSPAEPGMVWISTGNSSAAAFNALKKNGIQVYPLLAKQYVGGAWVDKTAKIYQGGEWEQLLTELYLYNNGDQCTDVTGGWELDWTGSSGILVKDTGTALSVDSANSNYSCALTKKEIDLTPFSKLYYVVQQSNFSYSHALIGVCTGKNDNCTLNFVASKALSSSPESSYIDISGCNEPYKIGCQVYSTRDMLVTELRLEV